MNSEGDKIYGVIANLEIVGGVCVGFEVQRCHSEFINENLCRIIPSCSKYTYKRDSISLNRRHEMD